MELSGIGTGIQSIEEDAPLFKEINFYARADALDFIDFHLLDRIEGLLQRGGLENESDNQLDFLKRRAMKLKSELEEIDLALFTRLREKIRAGTCVGSCFREMIYSYLEHDVPAADRQEREGIGYDQLDAFINGLLSSRADRPIPVPTMPIEPGMVFYQKTPARIVFGMAERAGLSPEDVFFDIGSGLGQVVILVNLLSGAAARGIEYEPAYYDYAKECASSLGLSDVAFIHSEACKADYSRGTVFFLYTPFTGSMLQDMLEILRQEARIRTIRIFTYGPCSSQVAGQHWLTCVDGKGDSPYTLYEFRSRPDKDVSEHIH